ncbi:hypothetical protein JI739_22600 [Ramlibacter sp. AW1]|uniref:Uncharacterized protein n=1 Tax=Ramlibacter aurantiacus TaxID=2801330 RepID=A0A937D8K3_9BURK|nr:hypothetical protein [Ramlibacter aurantiacus]MBL0423143.1 hypothetical protein [Ramlibacter aurantiacus]
MNRQGFRIAALLACFVTWNCQAQPASSAEPKCPDGRYVGAPAKEGATYVKDHYTWAVTAEFARRFCMPQEFVVNDLVGAEAIAYWHKKPTGKEFCERVNGEEKCSPGSFGHWIEIYVKSGLIPKYDPDVKYFVEHFPSSSDAIGQGSSEVFLERQRVKTEARGRGEVLEPPGFRRPYFGIGRQAEGVRVVFSYLARESEHVVKVRAAALAEHYFFENWKPGIDQIALEGWSNGSIAGARHTPPSLGYSLGIKRERERGALEYPSGYLHVIQLPAQVTTIIDQNDRAGGLAFDRLVNRFVEEYTRGRVRSQRPANN